MTGYMRVLAGLLVLSPLLACSAEATEEPAAASGIKPAAVSQSANLPERTLDCDLGHIVNFDPSRQQTASELRFDRMHKFKLQLASIPIRKAPPPDPIEAPEPVHPRTIILSDPDNIGQQVDPGFVRVADYWPERVELGGLVAHELMNVIVVSGFNSAAGTADMFLTQGSELTHIDPQRMYQGVCKVKFAG